MDINKIWAIIMYRSAGVEGSGYTSPSESLLSFILCTKRCGWLVNSSASYSGGPGFKSRPEYHLSWLRPFVVFPSTSMKILRKYLKIRPWPLTSTFFLIYWVTEKASLNEQQTLYLWLRPSPVGTELFQRQEKKIQATFSWRVRSL
jgi:hypothetical protein